MVIQVNGENLEIREGMTLLDLIKEKKVPENAVIVERNGEIVTDYSQFLQEGDVLELIRLVGGG